MGLPRWIHVVGRVGVPRGGAELAWVTARVYMHRVSAANVRATETLGSRDHGRDRVVTQCSSSPDDPRS